MHLRRRLGLILTTALVAAIAAPPALAADRVVRPVQSYSGSGWSITPTYALANEVLDDPVLVPAAPDTGTDYVYAHSTSASGDIGFAAPALTSGESVTGARLEVYAETGSARSLTLELRSGSTTLGSVSVPAGQAAAWHEVVAPTPPTLAQLSDLRMRAIIGGSNGQSTDVKIFAAYAAVSTNSPTTGSGTTTTGDGSTTSTSGTTGGSGSSTSTSGGGGGGTDSTGGGDAGSGSAGPPAVTLPVKALTAAPSGILAVPLTCQLAAGCTGTISTRLVGAAHSARRRKLPKRRFRLRGGQRKVVSVRLDRRTARFVRRKRRARIVVTVAIDGAPPVSKQVTIVARRTPGRR